VIRAIKLKNFRAFQEEIEVRVRPITILIGRNSAGKSSLLKFLLMLRQTLEGKSTEFFTTEGRHVRLGTWRDLRNSNSKRQAGLNPYFKYSIEIETTDLPSPEVRALWKAARRPDAVRSTAEATTVNFELPIFPPRADLERGQFTITGSILYGKRWGRGAHEVRGRVGGEEVFVRRTSHLEDARFLEFGQRSDRVGDVILDVASDRFLDGIRQEFMQIQHLSPVREESEQAIQTGSPPPGEVGHRGEYAIPHLARIFLESEKSDEAVLIGEFMEKVARVNRLHFGGQAAQLLTRARATNMETSAECGLGDFGFGVSQCLPIFVQGVLNQRGQLLLVEQPEAQLHPTAQLELGSFFVELWKTRGVPSLVETHSGNVLLRLRRLVKEGKLQPDDVSIAYFHIKDFDSGGGRTHSAVAVDNLSIDANGEIVGELPMEFFGADILEALEMTATDGG
jgi:predicted ATPase